MAISVDFCRYFSPGGGGGKGRAVERRRLQPAKRESILARRRQGRPALVAPLSSVQGLRDKTGVVTHRLAGEVISEPSETHTHFYNLSFFLL